MRVLDGIDHELDNDEADMQRPLGRNPAQADLRRGARSDEAEASRSIRSTARSRASCRSSGESYVSAMIPSDIQDR